MKILTVCGVGQGTSLILKMTVEDVLTKMGVQADVENTDVSTARAMNSDIIVLSQDLANTLGEETGAEVVVVNNYFDEDEVEAALSKVIK
ncbi:PTS sugar transporter subunit IIB [Atopococcus tabaci]|uniref:PTS sugar transporter subunit IIB n=1 Tax=Atopococcus tabaci TaxID=269774 RepID=UPI00042361B9|nr:PTS sugar transporter subunit IIB [Atopococcus tabaci]